MTRASGISILILVIVGTIIVSVLFGTNQRGLGELGLTGVFVVNFLGNATIFVPVPGLTAVGQTLIITTATTTNPPLVALVAGTAMTLAEITAYVVGRAGRRMSEEREIPLPGWLRELFHRGSKICESGYAALRSTDSICSVDYPQSVFRDRRYYRRGSANEFLAFPGTGWVGENG